MQEMHAFSNIKSHLESLFPGQLDLSLLMKKGEKGTSVTKFCYYQNMSLLSTRNVIKLISYLAPINRTKLGCLTCVRVLTSRLNSLSV